MKELWQLFLIFCRIGAFTFGGGYAMLPIIQREVVEKKAWAKEEEVIDYYAIAQCLPGIIAVNTSIFIGYKRKGIAGAVSAALGIVFPSLVIIILIAAFFTRFQDYPIVQHAFGGIRVAVVALITDAVIKMWKKSVKDWTGIFIFAVSFLVIVFINNISPIFIIVGATILGIIAKYRRMDE